MDKIETIYDRDHAIHVTLSDEEMALAQTTANHEDNLPKVVNAVGVSVPDPGQGDGAAKRGDHDPRARARSPGQ